MSKMRGATEVGRAHPIKRCLLFILLLLLGFPFVSRLPGGAGWGAVERPGHESLPQVTVPGGTLEIKDGMLVKGGRPFFIHGVMADEKKSSGPTLERMKSLNLVGMAAGVRLIFKDNEQPQFDGPAMRQRILSNLSSGRFTDLLWMAKFPKWAMKKYGDELRGGAAFYHYNILATRSRAMHRTAMELVFDRLSPGFPFSLDLANEPAFNGKVLGSQELWQNWLQRKYSHIGELNRHWKTSLARFSNVSVPDFVSSRPSTPLDFINAPLAESLLPVYRDWTLFNRERVTAWFAELASIARSKAPEIKIHVKMLPNAFFEVDRGISPIDIVEFSDFAGCDTWTSFTGSSKWAFDWQETWLWMDMLRSVRPRKPVFNSENHLLGRQHGSTSWLEFVPEDYFYAVLMGEAVHGQYGNLMWGRYPDRNVQDRPEAVRGIQRALADMERLAVPLSALSSVEPKVTVLFSTSTMIAESARLGREPGYAMKGAYAAHLLAVYEGLITAGVPVRFAYEERALAAQVHPDGILVIPGVTHLSRETRDGISQLAAKGMKIFLYNAPLQYDQVGQAVASGDLVNHKSIIGLKDSNELVQLGRVHGRYPGISVEEGGKETTDVEWRCASAGSEAYLYLLNLSNRAKNLSVKWDKGGKAVNLIDGTSLNLQAVAMPPLGVRIIKLSTN
jgi:hypothetical protein